MLASSRGSFRDPLASWGHGAWCRGAQSDSWLALPGVPAPDTLRGAGKQVGRPHLVPGFLSLWEDRAVGSQRQPCSVAIRPCQGTGTPEASPQKPLASLCAQGKVSCPPSVSDLTVQLPPDKFSL